MIYLQKRISAEGAIPVQWEDIPTGMRTLETTIKKHLLDTHAEGSYRIWGMYNAPDPVAHFAVTTLDTPVTHQCVRTHHNGSVRDYS